MPRFSRLAQQKEKPVNVEESDRELINGPHWRLGGMQPTDPEKKESWLDWLLNRKKEAPK